MEKTNIINISSKETSSLIYNWTFEHIEAVGLSDRITHILTSVCLLIAAFTVLFIINYIVLSISTSTFIRIINHTRSDGDADLLENEGLGAFSLLLRSILAQRLLPPIFIGFPNLMSGLRKFLDILAIFAVSKLINALLKTVRDILPNAKAFICKA